MRLKTFPYESFWRTLLNIYAIEVYILKFNISKPEYGCRHCRPFFQKGSKIINGGEGEGKLFPKSFLPPQDLHQKGGKIIKSKGDLVVG